MRTCDSTKAGNKEVKRVEAEVGDRSQGETGNGAKKDNEKQKGAFVNIRKKGKADRMKKELREITERKIEDMRKKIHGWLEREKSKKVKSLKEEWAKQMEEAEVRVRELTEKGRELEVKFEQLEGEVREKTGSNRREESEQEEANTGVSGKGRGQYIEKINSEREERMLNFVIKGVEEKRRGEKRGSKRRSKRVRDINKRKKKENITEKVKRNRKIGIEIRGNKYWVEEHRKKCIFCDKGKDNLKHIEECLEIKEKFTKLGKDKEEILLGNCVMKS
ncbi:hypothetical protein ALC53_11320 [Atta colombica]|uniref:Uncharacterized protein n=1 Tax=Atta colombica TaxID=520822 RepID=A0A151HZG7_9HYME|nr:hypothetical protein ALC53_11320 [Atta colombica]